MMPSQQTPAFAGLRLPAVPGAWHLLSYEPAATAYRPVRLLFSPPACIELNVGLIGSTGQAGARDTVCSTGCAA